MIWMEIFKKILRIKLEYDDKTLTLESAWNSLNIGNLMEPYF